MCLVCALYDGSSASCTLRPKIQAPRAGTSTGRLSPAKSLPSELMKLLPLGPSLVALDRLERLLGRYPEAKPTEHFFSSLLLCCRCTEKRKKTPLLLCLSPA